MSDSNPLEDARKDLADTASEGSGWTVHPEVPDRITPPIGCVVPGTPYLEPGETFGTFTARHVVSLISRPGSNALTTAQLDKEIADTVVELVNAGYGIETVGQPYPFDYAGGQLLAVDIATTSTLTL